MIDALQELARESAHMACFLAGPGGDEALDYDIVEGEMITGMQGFTGTLQKVLHWKDYGDVKQEPISPWFGAVSSPTSTPISTSNSSRESSPLPSSNSADNSSLYASGSPTADTGLPSHAEVFASIAANLSDNLEAPLLGVLKEPLARQLAPLLLDDPSGALADDEPLTRALTAEVHTCLSAHQQFGTTASPVTDAEAPASSRLHTKRVRSARSPGRTSTHAKKTCLWPSEAE